MSASVVAIWARSKKTGFNSHYECLIPGKCSEREQLNQVEEYAGRVYGDEYLGINYDGSLSIGETRSVKKLMGGRLTRASDVDSYLSWAKVHFFLQRSDHCEEGNYGHGGHRSAEWGQVLYAIRNQQLPVVLKANGVESQ